MDYDMDKIIEKAKKGDARDLLGSMNENDAAKIKGILKDKEACEKLLNSAQAQKILEMLKRGGMIGG